MKPSPILKIVIEQQLSAEVRLKTNFVLVIRRNDKQYNAYINKRDYSSQNTNKITIIYKKLKLLKKTFHNIIVICSSIRSTGIFCNIMVLKKNYV